MTDLDVTLAPQKTSSRARLVGINRNYWYPVGWADRLKKSGTTEIVLWEQTIAIHRDDRGIVHARSAMVSDHKPPFEDHEQPVEGRASSEVSDKTPQKNQTFPTRERYNIVWVFPGDGQLAEAVDLPSVPEYDDPDWLIVEIPAHFQVHFSMVNENPLDVFHGHLHRDLQGWHSPKLLSLERTEKSVQARYEVTFPNGWLARLLGLTKSKEPEVQRVIEVGYHYPHCRNTMPGISNYYFMRQPVGPSETRSFALMCLKIRLPQWFINRTRRLLSKIVWRFIVKPFLDQDIEVMESEQRNFRRNPNRRPLEINPVITAAQTLTVNQAEADSRSVAGAGGE